MSIYKDPIEVISKFCINRHNT